MTVTLPTSQIDLFADATLADPYAEYAELRDLGPAVWMERHQAWAVPRYAEIRAVARDHEAFSSAPNPGLEPNQPYMPPPAYMAFPPFHEPNWRYELWQPQKYYRGFHFWLDQF